eukprot:TRINITY_DN102561_c0_g1_i1.p1 TRINITY_DN102561_c0_g1~~TRINITY_DN102561_c0_g1_i1.p1  ORF type:complete len:266 (+),score=58.42 TRINITY_DN102561_c0_g1_i1:308-1105(+)
MSEPPQAWLDRISEVVANSIDTKLGTLVEKVERVEAEQQETKTQLQNVNQRLLALETSKTTMSTMFTGSTTGRSADEGYLAKRIEVKGFADPKDRRSGVDRTQAVSLWELQQACPHAMQGSVHQLQMVGSEAASFYVPVDAQHIYEVLGVFKEQLMDQSLNPEGKLFARLEPSPARKQTNRLFGKLLSLAESQNKGEVQAFWNPDYSIMARMNGGPGSTAGGFKELARLADDGRNIIWKPAAHEFFGLSTSEDLDYAFRAHRRSN